MAILAGLLLSGCVTVDSTPAVAPTVMTAPTVEALVARACEASREGARLERRGVDASVDHYYEATAYAAAALSASTSPPSLADAVSAVHDVYNEALRGCLRAAQRFGRLDPRRSLLINTPQGAREVPVRHMGFVWKPEDFARVVDPGSVSSNPNAHARQDMPGIGACLAVERPNPGVEPQDEFLPRVAVFNATAVLRPDPSPWLGGRASDPSEEVLEFYDPLRTSVAAFGLEPSVPLRSDLGLASARAYQIQEARGPFALAGFAMPERMLDKADIRMLEPYQPGKIPVLFVHGLLADPFIFTDMMIALQRTPGFLERHQIWVFRYPTGVTFVRSASLLRKQIERLGATLDPSRVDPALDDWTLVGYSMGGLLSRLQISWSGDSVWEEMSNVPFESLRMSEEARRTARELFFFEPSPRIRRVIFIATPHDGAAPAIALASRLTSRIVRRPADTRHLVEEVERANPGALRPGIRDLPSSVDALAAYSPLLPVIRRLPVNPAVAIHTIAGTGLHRADAGRGDTVVPLTSAHMDGALSEHHVRAIHNTIYFDPDTIDEVRRILGLASPR